MPFFPKPTLLHTFTTLSLTIHSTAVSWVESQKKHGYRETNLQNITAHISTSWRERRVEGCERQYGRFFLNAIIYLNLLDTQTCLLNYFVDSVLSFEYQRSPGSTMDSPRLLEPPTPLRAKLQPVQALPHPGITRSEATQRFQHLR